MSLVTPFKNLNNYFLENLEGTAYGLKKKNL